MAERDVVTEINGTFLFDPADPIYQDHFPGNPIVPGTQIIRAFREAARKILPGTDRFVIDNFKFRQFVPPGEYTYRMRNAGNFLTCELLDRNRAVVTGRLSLS